MTTPTPHDLRVWHYSKVLGWTERKIADEIGSSQTTVNRIIHRLEENPPSHEEMSAFIGNTPPYGLPAYNSSSAARKVVLAGPIWYALAVAITIVALSIAAVLIAAAISLLSHEKGDPGRAGPPGPQGPQGPAGTTTLCITVDPPTGHLTKISAPRNGSCPNGSTTVKLP